LVDAIDGLVGFLFFRVGGLGLVPVGGDVEQVDLDALRREGLDLEVPDELEVLRLLVVRLAVNCHHL